MSTNHHEDFKNMFEMDFYVVGSLENCSEEKEERTSLYELIKCIYHSADEIDIKENIAWSLNKCEKSKIKFLHDLKYSYHSSYIIAQTILNDE